jgi:hypothetical protein
MKDRWGLVGWPLLRTDVGAVVVVIDQIDRTRVNEIECYRLNKQTNNSSFAFFSF